MDSWQGVQSGEQTFGDELEFDVAEIRQLIDEDKDREERPITTLIVTLNKPVT